MSLQMKDYEHSCVQNLNMLLTKAVVKSEINKLSAIVIA